MKRKHFNMNLKKGLLPHMIDALFIGNHDRYPNGWVTVAANDKGCACIDALFPEARLAWGAPGDIGPADWRGFEINIPGVVAVMETKLPLEITRGADLDTVNPDALAALLAIGVMRQGGRVAIYRNGHLAIVQGHTWH
jgi:hypothetical protein